MFLWNREQVLSSNLGFHRLMPIANTHCRQSSRSNKRMKILRNISLGHICSIYSIYRVWYWTDYSMFDRFVVCPHSNVPWQQRSTVCPRHQAHHVQITTDRTYDSLCVLQGMGILSESTMSLLHTWETDLHTCTVGVTNCYHQRQHNHSYNFIKSVYPCHFWCMISMRLNLKFLCQIISAILV